MPDHRQLGARTARKEPMVFPPTRVAYEALINEVKALREELKRVRNEKKDICRSTAEVELQPKTSKARRNSWSEIYKKNTTLRKSKRLLGQKVEIDDGLEWRGKWSQRITGVSGLVGLIFWIARQNIAALVFAALGLIFVGILYYKNFSFVIAKRLLREINVVIILMLIICNCIIDVARPRTPFSPLNGIFCMVLVFAFVFLDAIKVKSRVFVLVIGFLFVLLNINAIYHFIFGDWGQGIVLVEYWIKGNKYTFMKRSTQQAIFLQLMLFSMNAIYTLFKDREMELMIFATGNIYRDTGTASRDVEQKSFVRKIKSEKKSLSEI